MEITGIKKTDRVKVSKDMSYQEYRRHITDLRIYKQRLIELQGKITVEWGNYIKHRKQATEHYDTCKIMKEQEEELTKKILDMV